MSSVLTYNEITNMDFGQASICIDACFILAFLDSNDVRGDLVGSVLTKWKNDLIKRIGIPVQVFSEVVHNLFKNTVLKSVVSAKKVQLNSSKGKKYLLNSEDRLLGESEYAKKLLRCANHPALLEIIQGRRVSISTTDLVKDFKRIFPTDREQLTPLYQHSIKIINRFISTLTDDFGFMVDVLESTEDTQDVAISYMSLFQLEIFDAMHLATTQCNSYDYFATLDIDFAHNLYSSGTPKILSIA